MKYGGIIQKVFFPNLIIVDANSGALLTEGTIFFNVYGKIKVLSLDITLINTEVTITFMSFKKHGVEMSSKNFTLTKSHSSFPGKIVAFWNT